MRLKRKTTTELFYKEHAWIATITYADFLLNLSHSFFKTLIDHEVTVELKNDIQLKGTLKSVDQYLNIKLDDISVVEELKYPHLVSAKTNSTPYTHPLTHLYPMMTWEVGKTAIIIGI